MESEVIQNLFLVLTLALIGGFLAKVLKLPVLVGYIAVGIFGSLVFQRDGIILELSSVGIILLMFSVGLELSLSKLTQVGGIVLFGAILQMILVGLVSFWFCVFLGFDAGAAAILSSGFSLSSTAVVVKMLEERGETNSIHGEIMIGWLLTQDLAVVPIVSFLPVLVGKSGNLVGSLGSSVLVSVFILSVVFFLGKMVVPYLIHMIASSNSRELMVLGGISLALGMAYLVSFFGISAALGAFLAGVVLSETQENHAVLAETRPLRDLFVVLFFVTLGVLASPAFLISHIGVIFVLVVFVLFLKFAVNFLVMFFLGYRGKVVLATSLGLTEIGEFSFVILLLGGKLGIINADTVSLGVSVGLVTLLLTPFLFRAIAPLWRLSKKMFYAKGEKGLNKGLETVGGYKNHVIICGYGRMGKWIGKALTEVGIPFLVVDYSQKVINHVKAQGIFALYGDPAEPSVLKEAGLAEARAVVVAIPDRVTQEEVITYCQTVRPSVPIFTRAHLDEDLRRLHEFKVRKVVQPEFEASLVVVRDLFKIFGKSKERSKIEISKLRRTHTVSA